MDERKDARTDGRTWATLNALPHSTNSGGIKKQTCLFTHKFPRNYRHATWCRYQLADQRCHGLIMREINDYAVVQIIAVNNAH